MENAEPLDHGEADSTSSLVGIDVCAPFLVTAIAEAV